MRAQDSFIYENTFPRMLRPTATRRPAGTCEPAEVQNGCRCRGGFHGARPCSGPPLPLERAPRSPSPIHAAISQAFPGLVRLRSHFLSITPVAPVTTATSRTEQQRERSFRNIIIICYLDDAFIQSNLKLIVVAKVQSCTFAATGYRLSP